MTATILPSRNDDAGFSGTIGLHAEAGTAWSLAFAAVAEATGQPAEAIRAFLDSRHGRHLADDVANALMAGAGLDDAIETAVDRWMGWTISRRTARETGIPEGLPYLTGVVGHAAIEAEVL